LSGGEKKRLQLLKLLVTNPNFLVLDEPTNDFDIDTLNVLEDFLEKFTGCLLLVSHDRYFMDHLVDQLFVFEGNGQIRKFNGNYTDYRAWVDDQKAAVEEKPVAQPKVEKVESAYSSKLSYKERQELDALVAEIEKLELEKGEETARLSGGSTDHAELQERAERIAQIDRLLETKTARWMALAERA
ncbi:MAG: ATP-binding cassette domain-containing protein, partial [Cyclobacteriaceae bacterium]